MYTIRSAGSADTGILTDMLVEAANWDAATWRRRVDLLADSGITRYISGWKRPADDGVVAIEDSGAPIGACWFRVLPRQEAGYGFVTTGVPELTLGVRPVWRAQGVGRALLASACRLAAERGHQRISPSVGRTNFAHRLYVSEGFVTIESGTGSDTMVKTLR